MFSDEIALVTGGTGLIGHRLVKRLIELGVDVTVVDDLSGGCKENLPATSSAFRFIQGSILDNELMDQVFATPFSLVFHLAASFANKRSVEAPLYDMDVNIKGTLKLLDRCRLLKSLKRFVYASSSCVFGSCDSKLSEESSFKPETPYAVSKLTGELYSLMYNELHKLPTVVLRYFNVYGPGEWPSEYRGVVTKFIDGALHNRPLAITGDGNETREFVFVDDAVESTIRAGMNEKASGQVFNVGSGKPTRLEDLALAINDLTNNTAGIVYRKPRHWDHIKSRHTSVTKAKVILGYVPETDLKSGLSATIDWFKQSVLMER